MPPPLRVVRPGDCAAEQFQLPVRVTHDRERFTWRRILRQNAQRSVVYVRTLVLYHRGGAFATSEAAKAREALISHG